MISVTCSFFHLKNRSILEDLYKIDKKLFDLVWKFYYLVSFSTKKRFESESKSNTLCYILTIVMRLGRRIRTQMVRSIIWGVKI